jgi:hypothetical protein
MGWCCAGARCRFCALNCTPQDPLACRHRACRRPACRRHRASLHRRPDALNFFWLDGHGRRFTLRWDAGEIVRTLAGGGNGGGNGGGTFGPD